MKEGFLVTVRELKVSYLNSILPKVRETLGKKKKLAELDKELQSKTESLSVVKSELSGIASTLKVSELPEGTKKELTSIKEQKEEIKRQIESSIENLQGQYDNINALIKFEDAIHQAMVDVLISDEYEERELHFDFKGFLEVTELQEEFTEEYVYLFNLSYTCMSEIFSIQTLNNGNAISELQTYANSDDIGTFIKVAIEKVKEQLNN